mmetsp:Transcript_100552/g.283576  ORF Transcript_100552/g.283576 Transcript_100552/m.283576 type:complete len:213 (+) Transcript_100552:35-673(+)
MGGKRWMPRLELPCIPAASTSWSAWARLTLSTARRAQRGNTAPSWYFPPALRGALQIWHIQTRSALPPFACTFGTPTTRRSQRTRGFRVREQTAFASEPLRCPWSPFVLALRRWMDISTSSMRKARTSWAQTARTCHMVKSVSKFAHATLPSVAVPLRAWSRQGMCGKWANTGLSLVRRPMQSTLLLPTDSGLLHRRRRATRRRNCRRRCQL